MDVENTKTNCSHAVDSRGKFGGIVPIKYFGNGLLMAVTKEITIAELIGENGLAISAQVVLQSILDITVDSIPALRKVRKGIEGREEVRWIWLPQNVVGTSWTGMQPFAKYVFGYGLPVSIMLSASAFEGTLGVVSANRVDGRSDRFNVYILFGKWLPYSSRGRPRVTGILLSTWLKWSWDVLWHVK